MKRTGQKKRDKGINERKRRYRLKYDRAYVARHFGDARHAPFCRGSANDWVESETKNRLYNYLYRFLLKQAGKDINVVFQNFKKLGWKSTHEMYSYWGLFDNTELWKLVTKKNNLRIDLFYISDDGTLQRFDREVNKKLTQEQQVTRQRAYSSRLTREQLEHNEREKRRFARESKNHQPSEKYAELVGSFYIEYGHKVILCPVYYRIVPPQTPAFNDVCWETRDDAYWKTRGNGRHRLFIPAKIVGKYREELIFEPYRLVPKNPHNRGTIRMVNPDEETLHGCGILIPRIEKQEAQQLLEKVTT